MSTDPNVKCRDVCGEGDGIRLGASVKQSLALRLCAVRLRTLFARHEQRVDVRSDWLESTLRRILQQSTDAPQVAAPSVRT